MIAAIYARKSTDQNDVAEEAKSVERQIDHARAYAAEKGWTVVTTASSSTTASAGLNSPIALASCG
jgi:DNA invertase Pin-like site-specific DNA recombinase